MNPFSAFLPPVQQRSPLAGAAETVQNLSRMDLSRQQERNRVREASLDNARADQYLKLQQNDQQNRFAETDQKRLQALLAEYQDAEDQGDQVRLSRAEQALKAFGGADVAKGSLEAAPKPLPGQLLPDLKAFRAEEPIDAVAAEEMATREKLRNRTEDPLLSQDDFEAQLIAGSGKLPERMERNGETTPEGKAAVQAALGAPEEVDDLGDVDSPEFKAAAAAEGTNGDVIDLDKEAPAPLQIGGLPQPKETASAAPQVAAAMPKALPGQLPTVISKGGKKIYESTGPSGRWAPMVESVFQPFTNHETPEIAAAAQRAQAIAGKLIQVDGLAPKDAIKMGMDYLQAEATRITNLERTKLGSRPRGVGGPASGILGPKDDRAESIDKYGDNIESAIQHAGIPASNEKLTAAENALMSDDPALQKDALKLLLQARSGLTVSEGERRSYSGVDGLLPLAQNTLLGWAGKPMTSVTRKSLLNIIRNMRQVNAQTVERITAREKRRYLAQNKDKVAEDRLKERAAALAGEEDLSDLWK